MLKVDLNSDLGESFGNYTLGLDGEVLEYVSSANIACGWHAGDPLVMDKTIALAKEHGVAIGAHTGFPDLLGFGRRNMAITPYEAYTYTKYQLGAFYGFAKAHGMSIQHIKPHGAFYNMCALSDCHSNYSSRDYRKSSVFPAGNTRPNSKSVFLHCGHKSNGETHASKAFQRADCLSSKYSNNSIVL